MANRNPIRYRGYYYDTESGLYYLNSRYYDPVTGRFINADGYVSTGQNVTDFNMFAYCKNNPIAYADATGTWSDYVLDGKEYYYNGSMGDFRNLERGLPPIEYTLALEAKLRAKRTKPVDLPIDEPDYPYYKKNGALSGRYHGGIDFASNQPTPIKAAFAGRVVEVNEWATSYGSHVIIESEIDGVKYRVWYAHMQSGSITVQPWDFVYAGDVIGMMGNTGNSTGQHLHFEMRKAPYSGRAEDRVDPRFFFN